MLFVFVFACCAVRLKEFFSFRRVAAADDPSLPQSRAQPSHAGGRLKYGWIEVLLSCLVSAMLLLSVFRFLGVGDGRF